MKFILLYAALVLIFHAKLFAQNDTLSAHRINKTGINYNSYAFINDKLFALNDSGKLVIWDLKKLDTVPFSHNNSAIKYTAITADRNNNIFLGTNKGQVFKFDPTSSGYSLYLKTKYSVSYMCFNSLNELFLIVRNAIYEPMSKKYWNEFENHSSGLITVRKSFLFFHRKTHKYFSMPQYTFLDSKDRWWMIASYGEFGGDIEIFDTKNKTIVNNKFGNINPGSLSPKSVFEDNFGNVYITCGLQHFMNFGEIYRIDRQRNIVKISDGKLRTNISNINNRNVNDYIGPGTFNKTDSNIYIASTSGFYKISVAPNSKTNNPIFLFNPNLLWNREPLAVGILMSSIKLNFLEDNRLLFLTRNDGFGLYKDKKLVFIK